MPDKAYSSICRRARPAAPSPSPYIPAQCMARGDDRSQWHIVYKISTCTKDNGACAYQITNHHSPTFSGVHRVSYQTRQRERGSLISAVQLRSPTLRSPFHLFPCTCWTRVSPESPVSCNTDADDAFLDRVPGSSCSVAAALHVPALREHEVCADIPPLTAYISRYVIYRVRHRCKPLSFPLCSRKSVNLLIQASLVT